ncbi:MAG: hypothetical protein M3094_10730, partial [Actinomycetia bacterium]|nr:hypothetical protein [Actinomycetes bacterium]
MARDPRLWPYPPGSIWNMPLGDAAALVDAQFVIPTGKTFAPEEDILILSPESPLQDLIKHDAAWSPTPPIRCDARVVPEEIMASLPIPAGWTTDPDYVGDRPNVPCYILLDDDTGYETQPFHICEADEVPVSQYHNTTWGEGPGSSIVTGGMADGDDHGGSHGGSKMTALGGTIRLGEWVAGSTITHVLKLVISGRDNFYGGLPTGHRWPANAEDSGWPDEYNGTVPEFLMGALLCLKQDFNIDALVTEPARIVARALMDYGGQTVDSSGVSSVFHFAVERGPQGRVLDEFEAEWGYSMDGRSWEATGDQRDFLLDMEAIYAEFWIVDDNAVGNVGGAGNRLAPLAPEFGAVEVTPGLRIWDGAEWVPIVLSGPTDHNDLVGVTSSQHHSRYTNTEAVDAVVPSATDPVYLRLDAANEPAARFTVTIDAPGYGTIFDGAAGTFMDTPDINRLDGDTAHLHQSFGKWIDQVSTKNRDQSQALTPVIGDF